MELVELVEKIVDQSKDKRLKLGDVRETVVNTLMADIEDWPAWYLGLFDWEQNYDFSGKRPSSLQKVNIATLKNVVRGYVEDYAKELKAKKGLDANVDAACLAVAERIAYWEDWYWDFADSVYLEYNSEEEQGYEDAYISAYGAGGEHANVTGAE